MSASSEPSNSELFAEVEELRAEVARLRDLLGLADRTGDEHQRSWAPTLFGATNPLAEVAQASAPAAKLKLIRSLFGARSDVYAQRWENQNSGKSGWSPAVRGGWSNKARKAKDYLPLTDEVLASHLRGDATIGIYPLLPGDTCALLACDFDDGSWALDALAFLDECHTAGVPAVFERSRSGDGAHVWMFFDQAVAATAARTMGMGLLRRAMTKRSELDLAIYDRFFPSQDFMPKGSFGNLQYVGRLLRAHGTKHDVELHDYLDEHVTVLARMHTKRLPAYKTLGFDTATRTPPPPGDADDAF